MKRRNNYDVTVEILQSALGGINKTNMVVKSNLNFQIIKKYIKNLKSDGLLIVDEKGKYVTTEKGIKFIENYLTMIESIKQSNYNDA